MKMPKKALQRSCECGIYSIVFESMLKTKTFLNSKLILKGVMKLNNIFIDLNQLHRTKASCSLF